MVLVGTAVPGLFDLTFPPTDGKQVGGSYPRGL
jgi:hypothetical protein